MIKKLLAWVFGPAYTMMNNRRELTELYLKSEEQKTQELEAELQELLQRNHPVEKEKIDTFAEATRERVQMLKHQLRQTNSNTNKKVIKSAIYEQHLMVQVLSKLFYENDPDQCHQFIKLCGHYEKG